MKKKNKKSNPIHTHTGPIFFPQFMRFCLLDNPLWIVNAKIKNGENKLEHKKKCFIHTVHSNMRYTDVHSHSHTFTAGFLEADQKQFECWWLWVDSHLMFSGFVKLTLE